MRLKSGTIRILDRDLGQSRARATNREDFKTLVSDVAMGRVGAIFSLEASRLARSNQDWHRLLELCAITSTLVIDEDGCYDPAEFNDDRLGMKGTFAQAELHIIRARLHGGKLNKAHKGELHFPLPVGLVFDDDKIALDPDQEVQGAVRTVFQLFERESSAYGSRRSRSWGFAFRVGRTAEAWDGKLLWGPTDPFEGARYPGKSVLCRHLRVRATPSLQADWTDRRDPHPVAPDAAGRVARRHSRSPSGLYQLGSTRQSPPLGGQPNELRTTRRAAREGLCLLQGLLDAERPLTTAGLWDRYPSYRLGSVSPVPQLRTQAGQPLPHTCRFDSGEGRAVNARCTAVGFRQRPCHGRGHLRATPCRTADRSGTPAPPSPCNKAFSGTSGFLWVFAGSSPIALPNSFESTPEVKALPSTGITRLRQYYGLLRLPSGPPRMPRRQVHCPDRTDLPRLPAPPFQRAVPITPVDRNGCARRLLPHPLGPSPNSSRVGVHKFPFEACSGFTRVTARWIAQPPNDGLCHEASTRTVTRPSRSSATRSTDNSLGGTSLHWFASSVGPLG